MGSEFKIFQAVELFRVGESRIGKATEAIGSGRAGSRRSVRCNDEIRICPSPSHAGSSVHSCDHRSQDPERGIDSGSPRNNFDIDSSRKNIDAGNHGRKITAHSHCHHESYFSSYDHRGHRRNHHRQRQCPGS